MNVAETSLMEYGGRYVLRGAKTEEMEGDPTDRKIVSMEFFTLERAREGCASLAYTKALQFRDKALNRQPAKPSFSISSGECYVGQH